MDYASQLYIIFYVLSLILIIMLLFLIYLSSTKKAEEVKIVGNPSVNLYIPCKDSSKTTGNNIESIISQDYNNILIHFIVGSKNDSAYTILRKTVKKHKILIAGKAKNCAQKNHNLLFGIKNSRKSDIYAFFDSDVHFEKNAVSKLISCLSNTKNTVVTSFPKRELGNKNLADTIYHFYYGFQYIFCSSFKSVWGGYYAIYRKDFEKLKVNELWGKRVSDDVSLTKLLIDKKFDVKFIKSVKIVNDNIQKNVGSAFFWMQRQTLMIKHYIKRYWIYSIIFVVCMVLFNLGLLGVTILGPSLYKLIFDIVILFAIFSVLHIINRILTKKARIIKDLRFFIPALLVILISVLSTIFINDIKWSGYRYKISKGIVKSITRL